ncbi:MAG: polysaccharide pyruvyl transferase family protein [Spirochaetes bacterium]|nr:polysaccharide pyruvyl transferase family protein [Spirochaetota bacterium]
MNLLILTPYAIDGLRNSGDDLIVESLIKLIKDHSKKEIYFDVVSIAKSTENREQLFNSLNLKDHYDKILMPAFRISLEGQENLKTRIKYLEKAIRLNIPVFALGCSWCVYPGTIAQTKNKINSYEKALLKYLLNDENSCVTCRDVLTSNLLRYNGLEVPVLGDLALFDKIKIKKSLECYSINKIAISLPHNIYYYKEVDKLKNELEKHFKFKVILTTHQVLSDERLYKKYVDLSGDSSNLDYYNNIDMHIGFRLHAHKWFLKNRKPSFLIAEDGRGWGHLVTFNGLGIHAAPDYVKKEAIKIKEDSLILSDLGRRSNINITQIISILQKEIDSNFDITRNTLREIDLLYNEYLKIIKQIIGWDEHAELPE